VLRHKLPKISPPIDHKKILSIGSREGQDHDFMISAIAKARCVDAQTPET
jgi:hypothetical protein